MSMKSHVRGQELPTSTTRSGLDQQNAQLSLIFLVCFKCTGMPLIPFFLTFFVALLHTACVLFGNMSLWCAICSLAQLSEQKRTEANQWIYNKHGAAHVPRAPSI
eukprot:GDKI01007722.1.p2 GENE.GDKI01007722.1~~GDKI01007722.1.p2  ORF type:complete len:105 (-),score=14.09 GDKI01007722.1:777-1091(-)